MKLREAESYGKILNKEYCLIEYKRKLSNMDFKLSDLNEIIT